MEEIIIITTSVIDSRTQLSSLSSFQESYGNGFTTTCVISVYYHLSCEFEPRPIRGVLDTILCDKVCQILATGRWFSAGTQVSSSNKTDRHDIIEILVKVALNPINQKT